MSRRGRSAPGWRPFRPGRTSNFGCQRRIAVMRVARAVIGQVHRAVIGMCGLRREALRHIPGIAGKDWRDVLGSDGLPDAERLRGK
jgi:hypothetical protein